MCQLCLQINYVLIETERVTKFKGVHQWIPQISSLLSNLQEEMYTLLSLLSPSYWLHSHRTTNLRGRSMMSRLLLRFSDRWPPAQSPMLNLVTWDFRDWKYTQLLLVVEVYIEKYISKSYSIYMIVPALEKYYHYLQRKLQDVI